MTHSPSGSVAARAWDWSAVRVQCLREAQRILGQTTAADDAAQEATLRVWLHQAGCLRPEQPEAWIATIARREALRLAAGRSVEAEPRIPEPADVEGERLLLLRLAVERLAASKLDPAERVLLRARYWADMTHEQIGRSLGVPTATVRVRLHRIRRRLRPHMAACAME